ncbi:hypothetical protein C8R46DRAFT_1283493 [Mycena filopes]|nr:hypothetical protein C8R46DRAFT_1283493 [Mycena filopes]
MANICLACLSFDTDGDDAFEGPGVSSQDREEPLFTTTNVEDDLVFTYGRDGKHTSLVVGALRRHPRLCTLQLLIILRLLAWLLILIDLRDDRQAHTCMHDRGRRPHRHCSPAPLRPACALLHALPPPRAAEADSAAAKACPVPMTETAPSHTTYHPPNERSLAPPARRRSRLLRKRVASPSSELGHPQSEDPDSTRS